MHLAVFLTLDFSLSAIPGFRPVFDTLASLFSLQNSLRQVETVGTQSQEYIRERTLRIKYFHDVSEQLKTNIRTNFLSEWVLGFGKDCA